MEQMTCEKCGLPMNYVGATKTKDSAPDWKCSDPNCKFKWDNSTKTWIPSDYITAKWNPKKPSPWPNAAQAAQHTQSTPNAPQIVKQSVNPMNLSVIEGLLREILTEMRKPKFPEPEDLSEFGA